MRRAFRRLGLALGLVGIGAAHAAAQELEEVQPVDVTGTVVSAATGAPISGAQVVVLGTSRGTLTGSDGTYTVVDLEPGEYRLQARSIGYRSEIRTLTLNAGGTATANFDLAVSAVPLSEVVISGQATGQARREIGTSVVTIDAEALENAPISSVSQLIQSRAPGVLVLPTGGKPGQGSRVVLRGIGTMTQTIQPLIYVDGVRIDNSFTSQIDFGGPTWSGLDDINPMDVDHIEIIRGASASALYGTEAAAGVIQIFTKKGGVDSQSWQIRSEYGVSGSPAEHWDVSPAAGAFHERFVDGGRMYREYLSVNGNVDKFDYFASTTFGDRTGVLPGSGTDLKSFRANMRVTPSQKVGIGLSTGYTRRGVDMPYDGSSEWGLTMNGLAGGEQGVIVAPEALADVETGLQANRFTGGATVEFNPSVVFAHRLTAGLDVFDSNNRAFVPWGSELYEPGRVENARRQARTVTVDYATSFDADITGSIASRTFAGVQGYDRDIVHTYGIGLRFAGPGLSTIGAASSTDATESRFESRGVGFYLEEQIGFNDRLFVTVGGRADSHSSFGEDVGYQVYPKADVSYLVSEEAFWPESLGTLRLRGAYGAAGRNPGLYLAQRSWGATIYNGWSTGLTTGNIGNPEMGPEVSRELELGFDAGLWNERLSVELTYYDQRTEDALYPMRPVPSSGFTEMSLQNIGEVSNRGLEVMVRGSLVDRPGFGMDAGLGYWMNENEVTDVAGQAPVYVGGAQWIREGYPVASFFTDEGGFLGAAFPERSLILDGGVRLGGSVRLKALMDYKGGHHLQSNTLMALDYIDAAGGAEDFEYDLADFEYAPEDYVYAADVWRLREVSLTYALPESLVGRINANGMTVSIAGRNLWRSQDYPGLEAEAAFDPASELLNATYFDTPLPRQIVAGVGIRF